MARKGIKYANLTRLLASLLAVILFIPGVPIGFAEPAYGADAVIPDEQLQYSGNGEILEGLKADADIRGYTKLKIRDGTTTIKENAFNAFYYDDNKLAGITELEIPESVTTIEASAFGWLSGIERVTIPGSVRVIDPMAFSGCEKLAEVTLLYGAAGQKLADNVFSDCTDLKAIYIAPSDKTFIENPIPAGVTIYANENSTAGQYASENSLTIKPLPYDSEAAYSYTEENGKITVTGYYGETHTGDTKAKPVIPGYIMGKDVVTIGLTAFGKPSDDPEAPRQNLDVESIKIPETVTRIEDGAFSGIENKEEVRVDVEPSNNEQEIIDWFKKNEDTFEIGDTPSMLQKLTVKAESDDSSASTLPSAQIYPNNVKPSRPDAPYLLDTGSEHQINVVPSAQKEDLTKPAYRFTNWVLTKNDASKTDVTEEYIDDPLLPLTWLRLPETAVAEGLTLTAMFAKISAPLVLKDTQKPDGSAAKIVCEYNGMYTGDYDANKVPITADSFTLENSYGERPVYLVGNEEDETDPYDGVVFRDRGLKYLTMNLNADEIILPQAFDEAYGLQQIKITDRHYSATDTIPVLAANTYYSRSIPGNDNSGVLFRMKDDGTSELVRFPEGLSASGYTLPPEVSSIGKGAFKNCTKLSVQVDLCNVVSIGDEAFMGCEKLGSVSNWGKTATIGKKAFSGTALGVATMPGSVTELGDRAFENCPSLTEATIPNRNAAFGEYVFDGSGKAEPESVVLKGVLGSTTETYANEKVGGTKKYANLIFKTIAEAGSRQVMLEAGAEEWLWLSTTGTKSGITNASVKVGAAVTVGVNKLCDETDNIVSIRVFDHEDNAVISRGLLVDPDDNTKTVDPEPLVAGLIARQQQEGLTLDMVKYRFIMPDKDVVIKVTTKPRPEIMAFPKTQLGNPTEPVTKTGSGIIVP